MKVISSTNLMEKFALLYIKLFRIWYWVNFPIKGSAIIFLIYRLIFGRLLNRNLEFENKGIIILGDMKDPMIFSILLKGLPAYVKSGNKLANLVKKNSIVFDVGACYGLYSMALATHIAPDGQVYSFEPSPSNYVHLERLVHRNKLSNIKIFNQGFSDSIQQLSMGIPDKSLGNRYKDFSGFSLNNGLKSVHSSNSISADQEVGKFVTLDYFVEQNHISMIDFIKIDVEGHELAVLEGAKESLKRFLPILQIELNSTTMDLSQTNVNVLLDCIEELGYLIYIADTDPLVKFQREDLENGTFTQFRTQTFSKIKDAPRNI